MNEHISYEYTMMNEMFRIKNGDTDIRGDVFNNMWNIVAYITAQNLIWYIADEVEIPEDVLEILDAIDIQIMSLTSARTTDSGKKLQPSDFVRLRSFIEEHKDKLGISSVGRTQDSDS